jgi:hypothetical protein
LSKESFLDGVLELGPHEARELPGPGGGDVDDAGVGDGRGEAMLEGERARHPIAGLADPDQRDPVGVDVGPGRHGVDHRGQHRLPVVPERDPLQEQAGLLAGAVEGHGVVAALVRRPAAEQAHVRGGAVAAVVQDHQRSPLTRRGIGGAEDVARQRGVLVGELEPLAGHRRQVDELVPAGAVSLPGLQVPLGRARTGDQVQPGRVVVGRAEIGAAGADEPSGVLRLLGVGRQPLGVPHHSRTHASASPSLTRPAVDSTSPASG